MRTCGVRWATHALLVLGLAAPVIGAEQTAKAGCLVCHKGIGPIRDPESGMMILIRSQGEQMGAPEGCVVCHKGDPKAKEKAPAHRSMISDPGSIWIANKTCGPCHPAQVAAVKRSLMQTEAGKIQGTTWDFGALEGRRVRWGNYAIQNVPTPADRIGSPAYQDYMARLRKTFPDVFPSKLEALPLPSIEDIVKNPSHSAFTYLRHDCQRCHVGVKGAKRRGDYRGMGCSACHIPYGADGYYEGGDPTIPKNETGHLLTHQIQATREAKVAHAGRVYSGVPDYTCSTCHNRGKRVGVSFQGLMESAFPSPLTAKAEPQPSLHGKKYLYIREDVHHRVKSRKGNPEGRLLCQDCHTTIDVHGDGSIFGTTLAQVEVECADCHGTPERYPWELPLGYGEEFGRDLSKTPARGVGKELLPSQRQGTVYSPRDGYLLTARGNPFGNVVREGDDVVVHSASGLDFKPPLLKTLNQNRKWRAAKAGLAMGRIKAHLKSQECYTCHTVWAPQCYGCHVRADYSAGKRSLDWLSAGAKHLPDGSTGESRRGEAAPTSPGHVSESRSYMRWEYPALGINGEGRVTPVIPGCQVVSTVIGPDGKILVRNKIWRATPNDEGAGPEGQRGLDMAPAAPHTVARQARSCESCHTSPKALGYGIAGGRFLASSNKDLVVDLAGSDGVPIAKNHTVQIPAIPDLPMDLSQFVTRAGKQLQTVGSHWPLSGPLSQEQREHMERVGVCIACHNEVSPGAAWIRFVMSVGKYIRPVHTNAQHRSHLARLVHEAAGFMILSGCVGGLVGIGTLVLVAMWIRKRKRKRKQAPSPGAGPKSGL